MPQNGQCNMARFTVTASMDVEFIDIAVLLKLCADPEGCEVVLTILSPGYAQGKASRLLLVEPNKWFSTEAAGLLTDGTATQVMMFVTARGPFDCVFSDADNIANQDTGPGFALRNTGSAEDVVCEITFID